MHRMLVLAVLIAAMLQPVCATEKSAQTEPVPSIWAMELPAGWLQIKPPFEQCLMAAYDSNHKDHIATVNVTYNTVGDMTLDQVFKAGEMSVNKTLENYKLLEHKNTTVGGLPAYYVICTFTGSKGTAMKTQAFVVIRKGMAYTFSFDCDKDHFSEHTKDFDSIIKSVKWMEPQAK